MIPENLIETDLEIEEETETTKTYKLSETNIQGYTENLEALQQAIYKELNTEKYETPIYSFSYGIEIENLIGKDQTYVKIELMRRIKECLLKDERIESADNFSFTITGDLMICMFDVVSIYGNMTISKEVVA